MQKRIVRILAALACALALAGTALAERDWSQLMEMPTEEQLALPGTLRSPYIAFYPDFGLGGTTAFSMDFRIAFDPAATYICPACWNLDVSEMEKSYVRVVSDYGSEVSGYFGFQVLENGEKVVIMSLWDAFCEDGDGQVTRISPRVLYPQDSRIREHTPETNGEGSFVQCMFPYAWETGRDYRLLMEQETGEQGTEVFTVFLMEPEGDTMTEMFRFDSGLTGVWTDWMCGFVENFDPQTAAWPRSLEFWNVRARERSSGTWKDAASVAFSVNSSVDITDYEGSWNVGADEDACWIITSGVPGLCGGPETLTGYKVPVTESGEPR